MTGPTKRLAALAGVTALALGGLRGARGAPKPTRPYTFISLGTLGGSLSEATGANDAGQVVGFSVLADGSPHAFFWKDANGNHVSDPGEMVDLGSLGSASVSFGINNLGE